MRQSTRLRCAGAALTTSLLLGSLANPGSLWAQRAMTVVSVGDSVASGEGNPDVPQEIEPNLAFNPLEHSPNPDYDPFPEIPNLGYNPFPNTINPDYNPVQTTINPDYQPFIVPDFLKLLLPGFPPHDPQLTIPNPSYDPNLTLPNPNYDPDPLQVNPDYDPRLFTDVLNPDFNDIAYLVKTPAQWAKEEDHRSNFAGPALAAAELIRNHPEYQITFLHRAKSGADIAAIGGQIDRALVEAGGRIDVLMISAGGNDIGSGGFGALLIDAINSFKTGVRPSQDADLNQAIADSFDAMSNKFAGLAAHIDRCAIGEVFITEYFDLTRGADGQFCFNLDTGNPDTSFRELEWAYSEIIVPLNEAIAAAATQHGWRYVGGIADLFRNHGYCAARIPDPRPALRNPDFDPRPVLPNWDYHPIERKPNLDYSPLQRLPNLSYNPIANRPNLNYNPVRNIPNPNFNPNPLSPDFDPRVTIPNPDYDPRLTVPNPNYDPDLTILNPDYDPNPTVSNPDYNPNLTVPNPDYDPDPTIPNPDFELGLIVEENWVVRLEESFLVQGDEYGTAHPNRKGHEAYRDRLVQEIQTVGLDTILPCPGIQAVEVLGPTIRLAISSEYPMESLELQSTSDLSAPAWESEPVELTDLGAHELEAKVQVRPEIQRYFRVILR